MKAFGQHWILTMFAGAMVALTAIAVGFCVFTWHKAVWPASIAGLAGLGMSWVANRKIEAAKVAWEKYMKGETL